jgi:hypothetical protein
MAGLVPGLVPAIHVAPFPANPKLFRRLDDVAECACIRPDDRDKPGHDGVGHPGVFQSFPPKPDRCRRQRAGPHSQTTRRRIQLDDNFHVLWNFNALRAGKFSSSSGRTATAAASASIASRVCEAAVVTLASASSISILQAALQDRCVHFRKATRRRLIPWIHSTARKQNSMSFIFQKQKSLFLISRRHPQTPLGRSLTWVIMAAPSKENASTAHRRRAPAQGLVRVEVKPDKADAGLLRMLAETLRADPERAKSLRSVLEQALTDPQVKTAFDLFGSDLPDEGFAGVFDQPRQKGCGSGIACCRSTSRSPRPGRA